MSEFAAADAWPTNAIDGTGGAVVVVVVVVDVVVVDVVADHAQAVAQETGGIAVTADVAKRADVERAVATAVERRKVLRFIPETCPRPSPAASQIRGHGGCGCGQNFSRQDPKTPRLR